jgi:hypothetical protein
MVALTVAPILPTGCHCLFVLDDAGREQWSIKAERKILGVSLSGDGQYAAIGLQDASMALFSGKGHLLWQGKSVGLPTFSATGEILVTFNNGGNISTNALVEVFLPDRKKAWTLRRKGNVWRAVLSDQHDLLLSLWTGEVLFIDVRKVGTMVDRTHRELTAEDISRIAGTYHAWRGEKEAGKYEDVPGSCKSGTLDDIRKHGHVLTPGRYVGAEAQEDDGEPFEEKMKRFAATLREQQAEAAKLDIAIAANLKELGYGG